MIIACSCKNAYQDSKYGKGNRVANKTKDGGHRCTVCGIENKTKTTTK